MASKAMEYRNAFALLQAFYNWSCRRGYIVITGETNAAGYDCRRRMATNPPIKQRRAAMADTFETFIASERERLNKERQAIFNQQHELEAKLAAGHHEMRAIDAYEAAKCGKAVATRQTGRRAMR